MGFEAAVAVAGEFFAEEAVVGAVTDIAGAEFLAADVFADATILESVTPTFELAGAYEEVGSFAGNADWFNAFSPGSITEFPSDVFDPFAETITLPDSGFTDLGSATDLGGYPDLPTTDIPVSDIQTSPQILVDDSGVSLLPEDVKVVNSGELAPSFYDQIYAKAADAAANANVTNIVTKQVTNTGINVAKQVVVGQVSQATGVNPQLINYAAGSVIGSTGPYVGTPGIVPTNNTGYGTTTIPSYGPQFTTAPNSVSVPANYQVAYNDALETYEILDNNNQVVASGLTEQEAMLQVQELGINEPVIDVVNTNTTVVPGATIDANYQEVYNANTGRWDVIEQNTGQTIATGLTQQGAILAAQDLNVTMPAITLQNGPGATTVNVPGFDAFGNLLPGYILNTTTGLPVSIATGAGNFLSTGTTETLASSITQGLLDQARQQQTIRDQRQKQAAPGDWRVRLRLGPRSNYLYNAPNCGPVLWPLRNTDGVIFPYTPSIDLAYRAEYDPYTLTHSNYKGYFYKGSYVDSVNMRATFTAQDTAEANYLLAVIHFFRSATKMFYGQDAQRGAPPPLVFISGYGDFQFNEHPCVISQFNYSLPADVDYIRAQSSTVDGTNLLTKRDRQTVAGNPLSYALNRLATVGLSKGALDVRIAAPTLGIANPTYVPTKIEIQLTLLPMQSRDQVSKQFSVQNFANGNLLKGGFW